MILTVGNTKGGVGKSTLALNLAVAKTLEGGSVWLIDADRQGTVATAMAFRAQAGHLPLIECSHLPEGKDLHSAVLAKQGKFDAVVIDAGGRDSTALRAALALSGAVLIPFAPRSLDLWALQDMAGLVTEARTINPGLQALAVLNGADAVGSDNKDAAAAVASYPELTYLAAPIRRRKSFANAAGMGLSVLEAKPKDAKAVQEVKALAHIVFTVG